MNSLILGASGFIGSALLRRLQQKGRSVGTCRSHPAPGLIPFDMASDDPAALPVDWASLDVAVAAVTLPGIEDCYRRREYAREVQVTGMARFFAFAAQRNIRVVFLSSDYVYDGSPGADGSPRLHVETEPPAPTTEYGLQKMEAEQILTERCGDGLIVRLSKNIALAPGAGGPFAEWAAALRQGRSLRLATDQIFCVAWAEDTVRALELLIERRASGVFNLAAPAAHSRYEWAERVCRAVGGDPGLLTACSIDDFQFSEPRPLDVSMNSEKFTGQFGFEFTSEAEMFERLGKNFK